MNISLNLKRVSGVITIPASKSLTQRLCAAALLHKGTSKLHNFGKSEDELAALSIIKSFGAELTQSNNIISIKSDGSLKGNGTIHCSESGLAARLFTPIAALSNQPISIEGSGSLLKRPMHFFADVLQELNVTLIDFDGHLPFVIRGPLDAKNILVDGSLSSQFISGLLFAFAYKAKDKVEIEVKNLVSKPYIDLTLEVLSFFGKKITQKDYRLFCIDPSTNTDVSEVSIHIESDWSSAAFWIAAATINGSVSLLGLQKNGLQADKKMLEIVEQIGAKINWDKQVLQVSSGNLNAFVADLNDAPDLLPILAVLAASCNGTSTLKGVHRLIHKESNRKESIVALLTQLQVQFNLEDDELLIEGKRSFPSITYHCPNDHRMAMAAALASMRSGERFEIMNAECVQKSYPDFWNELLKQHSVLNFC